jgi:hypothetical protein
MIPISPNERPDPGEIFFEKKATDEAHKTAPMIIEQKADFIMEGPISLHFKEPSLTLRDHIKRARFSMEESEVASARPP